MLCDVVRRRSSTFVVVRRRRRWAHASVIHAASHFDHKKKIAWVLIHVISMHTCGPVSIIMVLCLESRSSANKMLEPIEVRIA